MLRELKKYENLGTPTYFWELLHILKSDDLWTKQNIQSYFFNKIIDGRSIFDGCLPLLEFAKIISFEESTQELKLSYDYRNILLSEQFCQQKLLEAFLKELNEDEEFHSIFLNSHFDYLELKSVVIDRSAFPLQYSNLRRLLIDFSFLVPHPTISGKFTISTKWKKHFDLNITPKVRKILGNEELKRKIEQQELNGEEAEKFVLNFEKKRTEEKDGVQWIAPYDSSAGFDVLSFHSRESDSYRYIEVKSYSGDSPYFYWTKNEINVAGRHAENYFIYLVNRDEMNNVGYVPRMISNPVKNILENGEEWQKSVDKYFIYCL